MEKHALFILIISCCLNSILVIYLRKKTTLRPKTFLFTETPFQPATTAVDLANVPFEETCPLQLYSYYRRVFISPNPFQSLPFQQYPLPLVL